MDPFTRAHADEKDDACGWVELVHRVCMEKCYTQDQIRYFLFGFQSLTTPSDLCMIVERTLEVVGRRSDDEVKDAVECVVVFFASWVTSEAFRDLDGHLLPAATHVLELCQLLGHKTGSPLSAATSLSEGDLTSRAMAIRNIQGLKLKFMKGNGLEKIEVAMRSMQKTWKGGGLPDPSTLLGKKVSSTVVAEALTSFAWSVVSVLRPNDFLLENSLRLKKLAKLFDKVCYWVATVCVRANSSKAVTFFIRVAEDLLKMNNYDMLMAVMSGLGNVAVTRLNKLWGDLSVKQRQKFEAIDDLMSPAGNHRSYRQKLKEVSISQPCLPYVALVLRDLIHVKDAHTKHVEQSDEKEKGEDERSEGASSCGRDEEGSEGGREKPKKLKKKKKLVNVSRILQIGKKLDEYFAYISNPYSFSPDEKLVDSIRSSDVYTEDELYLESLKMQPSLDDTEDLTPTSMSTFGAEQFKHWLLEIGVEEGPAAVLAALPIEELLSLNRKELRSLGVERLKHITAILNLVHVLAGVPEFLTRTATTWTNEDVIQWGELMELHKGVLKAFRARQMNGMTLIQLDEAKISDLGIRSHSKKSLLDAVEDLKAQGGSAISLRFKLLNAFLNSLSSGEAKPMLQLPKEGIPGGSAKKEKAKKGIESPVGPSNAEGLLFLFHNLDTSRTETGMLSAETTLFSLRMHVKRVFGAQMKIFTKTDDSMAPLKSDAQLIRIIQDARGQVDIYLQYSKT